MYTVYFYSHSAKDVIVDIIIVEFEPTEATKIAFTVTLNGNVTLEAEKYIGLTMSYYENNTSPTPVVNITARKLITIHHLKVNSTYTVSVQAFADINGERVNISSLQREIKTGKGILVRIITDAIHNGLDKMKSNIK